MTREMLVSPVEVKVRGLDIEIPSYVTTGIFNSIDLLIVWDFVVFISISFPSVSVTMTVKPPSIVIGGRAMMNGVAVSVFRATPSPQSKVTLLAIASVRMIEGVLVLETVTSAAPQRISSLLPVTVMEAMEAVPFNCSFRPPRTFLNLRCRSSVSFVTAAIGNAPLPKLPSA